MAIIDDLIAQINDPELRDRISKEVGKLTKNKKFGLVYEEHIPECTPLYDVKIKRGSHVARRDGKISEVYLVRTITDKNAHIKHLVSGEECEMALEDLVAVAQFGEPIYPYLKPIDTVQNDPDGDLWHMLIEADNYHALQLLAYLYPHSVDCIYIDPPYNTGARDWKYNNDYVDSSDSYRHSKWLSMMEKRLRLAKQLLNPKDSVLIVTIDEKEYLHLGCLLEEMFSEANMQMVSISINPSGAIRKDMFSRADEFAYFLFFGNAHVTQLQGEGEETEVRWWYLRRLEYGSRRGTVKGGTAQFYPIYVDNETERIVKIGNPLPHSQNRDVAPLIPGTTRVFPIRDDGLEMNWGVTGDTLQRLIDECVVRVSKNKNPEFQPYTIKYLSENYKDKVKSGRWAIRGFREDGSKIVVETRGKITRATTVWRETRYDAKTYGTVLLKGIIGDARFSFPKSLYAVKDSIYYFLADKPNSIVVDFFAGSGTTLHAVNLLNAEDGGHRRCIMVTNNEVSDAEAKDLTKQGYHPGDDEWEKLGIARYVTWPRTVCSIEGHDVNGNPIKGTYLGSDLPMADGFKTNAAYYKLGFLSKEEVSLGRQFRELLPLLWTKAGMHHACPALEEGDIPAMLLYPKNRFAVLTDETAYRAFAEQVNACEEIETVYIITDSQAGYREMIRGLWAENTYQLYRDYLDNFRINTGR